MGVKLTQNQINWLYGECALEGDETIEISNPSEGIMEVVFEENDKSLVNSEGQEDLED